MYDAVIDPYCYEGTTILKNIPHIRDQVVLDAFEAVMTAQRADERFPEGALDSAHYCAIHRHLFQDIYVWAGEFRTVRIAKEGSAFCYPEYIAEALNTLFGDLKQENYFLDLSVDDFTNRASHFLATLNAIHPFREGNGRTQTTFLAILADSAEHPLNLERLIPERFMEAMIASFKGSEESLTEEIEKLIAKIPEPKKESSGGGDMGGMGY